MKKLIKIIVFDMDGVLVNIKSSWAFVHKAFNIDESETFKRYLRGEFDYLEFMRKDIGFWGHIHVNQIRRILNQVPLMPGTEDTFNLLHKNGYVTAIISSGISILAENLKKKLDIDHIFANKILEDKNGILTGEGNPVVPLWDKGKVLENLLISLEIKPDNCAVVGDSIFDIPLFDMAGFSIAFNSKDKRVKEIADVCIQNNDLRDILPYFISFNKTKSDY
ncbi:MAG: HAD family phosphatase [Candidatus Bathyarchaeota archaeon]|nr:HAD family phosphatase [Candidatus Bathyarchaeota archaeon]